MVKNPLESRRTFIKAVGGVGVGIATALLTSKSTLAMEDDEVFFRTKGRGGSNSNTLRLKARVLPIRAEKQSRPLSCEACVAGMGAEYVTRGRMQSGDTPGEEYFIGAIPRNLNPHEGFSGNINGNQAAIRLYPKTFEQKTWYGMGVYAEPVEKALKNAGIEAKIEYGTTTADLAGIEEHILKGSPVGVWVVNPHYCTDSRKKPDGSLEFLNCGNYDPGKMKVRRLIGDREVDFIEGEHIVLARGTDSSSGRRRFLVNDPGTGTESWVSGFNHWEEFNGMRIVFGVNN